MLYEDSARNRLVGIGLISLAYVCYTLLDGSAKWVTRFVPVLEVVWLRFVGHVLISALLLGPRHGLRLVRTRRPSLQALRAAMLLSMTALNFTALQYLQLTVTTSIFFTVPIFVALLGVPLLGERIDARRWAAIVVGFAGVLVIVRPFGSAFHPAMLLSILNAVISALFAIVTRRLSAHDPPEATQFLSALGAAVAISPFGIAAWQTPTSGWHWTLLLATGLFGAIGHYVFALAHRYAPASVLGPFIYPQVIYMALLGYVAFGDVPDGLVLVGAAIVIGSGLFLLWQERARRT